MGRAGLSPCSGASRSLLPGTAGPNPPRCGLFRTVRPLHVQLAQGTPGEARSGVWHCPLVLPVLSGRGQEAQVTDSSAHPALDTNRPPKAPGASGTKGPSLPKARRHCQTEGTSTHPPWGGAGGQGRRSSGLEEVNGIQPTLSGGPANGHTGAHNLQERRSPPPPPAIRALPRAGEGLLRASNAPGSHVNGRQPDVPVRAQRHARAHMRARPRPPGRLQLSPPGPRLAHPGPSEIPPCGDIQEQNSSSL